MTRDELEHIIRASAEITDQYEFIVVGSQSKKRRPAGTKTESSAWGLLEYGYVKAAHALDLIPTMHLDADAQRRLRAALRRWVKALRDAGHDISDS